MGLWGYGVGSAWGGPRNFRGDFPGDFFGAPDISATHQSLCLFQIRKCACGSYGVWGGRWTAGAGSRALLGRRGAVSAMLARWGRCRAVLP